MRLQGCIKGLENFPGDKNRANRVFSLTWPASMQIFGTKEFVCIRKEFNSQRIGLGHQHAVRFIVLGHQYGGRDVM